MSTITIKVIQEDIDKGVAEDCERCPIAIAIERAMPGFSADVAANWTVVQDQSIVHRYRTPAGARHFIRKFDTLGATFVRPFEFELPIAAKPA